MVKSESNSAIPAMDPNYVSSISSSSVAVGQCLHRTLTSIEYNQEEDEQGAAKRPKIESDATNSIMRKFGEAMAETQLNEEGSLAPRVLLRGRLDHYNNLGQNWRISIDNVKLQKRPRLLSERPKPRPSAPLWDQNPETLCTLSVDQEIHILGYNDV